MLEENKNIKKHPWPLLLGGVVMLGVLGYVILNFSPRFIISAGTFQISLLIPFFIVFFLSLYALIAYITISSLQGLLLATAVISYLLLRFFGITHILFGLLLLAMVISLEFALYKKK